MYCCTIIIVHVNTIILKVEIHGIIIIIIYVTHICWSTHEHNGHNGKHIQHSLRGNKWRKNWCGQMEWAEQVAWTGVRSGDKGLGKNQFTINYCYKIGQSDLWGCQMDFQNSILKR